MLYLPPFPAKNLYHAPPGVLKSGSLGMVSLAGLFGAVFTLTLTTVIAPQFFRLPPVATLASVVGLALILF